ncbi:hypothetical protein [Legionella fairfieldensis]|uniref:hypothetical protein n=1 Tax=Legionella fairfieldensis TaxID=45064 RepID=UPI00048B2389|nr:hypothetical protein [Legionella fairfieldensis]
MTKAFFYRAKSKGTEFIPPKEFLWVTYKNLDGTITHVKVEEPLDNFQQDNKVEYPQNKNSL